MGRQWNDRAARWGYLADIHFVIIRAGESAGGRRPRVAPDSPNSGRLVLQWPIVG